MESLPKMPKFLSPARRLGMALAGDMAGSSFWGMLLLLLVIFLASLSFPHYGYAQTNRINGPPRNIRLWGFSNTLVNSTVATTTPVTMLSVTNTPINDPNATNSAGFAGASAGQPYEHLQVTWSADVTKATASTGTCQLFINGAAITNSAKTATSAGGEEAMGGVIDVPNTTTGSQAVILQCKSGDTNTFTINNAQILANEVY